jgi:putative transcriptional regulator
MVNDQGPEGSEMKKASVENLIIQRLEGFTEALENKEVISERFTCRKVELDLRPEPYSPGLVKKTRDLLGASQAVFALFLGVSVKTVRAWEQGINTPSDMACRFMDEIRFNSDYMRKRLQKCVKVKGGRAVAK